METTAGAPGGAGLQSGEEAAFVGDDVANIIKESVDYVLANQQFNQDQVGQWTQSILETCMKRLTSSSKPYKFVITCIIMQKNGGGLHTAASCYWDNQTDGSRTVRWENKTMYCTCSVFGLAL
eukprot:TRINITY_DN6321_c0_g1_i1.p4 TRINITY_DN6321_c0_g1~~TRINITY_DN6321_c0_g1_i1.p4  ORF type:complete len:123 (-),score=14.47 TRINITY_DN6321_c0_g1_i1:318-686(-)